LGFNISFGKSGSDQLTQKYVSWVITGEGQRALERYSGAPTVKFRVLSTLSTLGGSANVDEISQYSKVGKDVVDFQLKLMSQTGFVRRGKMGESGGGSSGNGANLE